GPLAGGGGAGRGARRSRAGLGPGAWGGWQRGSSRSGAGRSLARCPEPAAGSPPQPPRPDYRDRRPGAELLALLRAYRAQKERDFEDPYSGPGSSLRKLRALERRPPTPPDGRYLSPKHRLIKIDSGCEGAGGCKGAAAPAIAWSPPGGAARKVLIADDYSDPFDAKSELNKAVKGENTGYMEPYEAQRIMSGKDGAVSPLYDTPYEPEGNGVESDTDSLVSQRLRESKLPQDDDRPADEYDQPWEWNKVTIPALAGGARSICSFFL
uniref:Src homology 2 domain containing F n=1 Tax=Gopherus agassizii TaxID=38772 RepID=A0A452I5E6_9SAUR